MHHRTRGIVFDGESIVIYVLPLSIAIITYKLGFTPHCPYVRFVTKTTYLQLKHLDPNISLPKGASPRRRNHRTLD